MLGFPGMRGLEQGRFSLDGAGGLLLRALWGWRVGQAGGALSVGLVLPVMLVLCCVCLELAACLQCTWCTVLGEESERGLIDRLERRGCRHVGARIECCGVAPLRGADVWYCICLAFRVYAGRRGNGTEM